MPDYKAFALAKDTEGNWAYGYGKDHLNQAAANEQAMSEFRKKEPPKRWPLPLALIVIA